MDAHLKVWISGCLKKRRYSTRKLAKEVIIRIKKIEEVKLRVYHCAHCHGWHLTSKV